MGCFSVMFINSIALSCLLLRGCESISEERFLKLVKIVENQNARISDMENTIHGQEVQIKRLTERLNNMEIKFRKNELKCDKSNWWSLKALDWQMRHSVIQNTDSTLKDKHIVLQKEPAVRNRYDVNTSKLNFALRNVFSE